MTDHSPDRRSNSQCASSSHRSTRGVARRCSSNCRTRLLLVGDAKRCRALVAAGIRARGLPLVEANTPLEAIVHLQADDWTTSVVLAGALATADQKSFLAFLEDDFPNVEIIEP